MNNKTCLTITSSHLHKSQDHGVTRNGIMKLVFLYMFGRTHIEVDICLLSLGSEQINFMYFVLLEYIKNTVSVLMRNVSTKLQIIWLISWNNPCKKLYFAWLTNSLIHARSKWVREHKILTWFWNNWIVKYLKVVLIS